MGAGGIAGSLSYRTASFMFSASGTPFTLALTGSNSLGSGFDDATFQITDNGNILLSKSFSDLATAQAFFSNDLMGFQLAAGSNDVQLAFSEMMSGGEGFSFDYFTSSVSTTPLPSSLPLFITGLSALALMSWLKKRRAVSFEFHAAPPT